MDMGPGDTSLYRTKCRVAVGHRTFTKAQKTPFPSGYRPRTPAGWALGFGLLLTPQMLWSSGMGGCGKAGCCC